MYCETSSTIPIIIVTGFLGAGKTTLLNRALASPEFARTALIINEIGSVPLDHLLVEKTAPDPIVLSGGCICCTYTKNVGHVLRDLHEKVRLGLLPAFDRVVIETTGLADPSPILQELATDTWVNRRYRAGPVIALADSCIFGTGAEILAEAAAQIAVADRLVITKTDLVDQAGQDACRNRIAEINPHAAQSVVVRGDIAADILLMAPGVVPALSSRNFGNPRPVVHSSGIATATLELAGALQWSLVSQVFDDLTRAHGAALLRLKGLISLVGMAKPVAIHAAHGVFFPPELIARDAADEDNGPTCRVVLVGLKMDVGAAVSALRSRLEPRLHQPASMEGVAA